jgi:hypothetical protein
MTPEDEALITKAALLGCPFKFTNGRYYGKMGSQHPFSKKIKNTYGMYGQKDPVVLARAWVEHFGGNNDHTTIET